MQDYLNNSVKKRYSGTECQISVSQKFYLLLPPRGRNILTCEVYLYKEFAVTLTSCNIVEIEGEFCTQALCIWQKHAVIRYRVIDQSQGCFTHTLSAKSEIQWQFEYFPVG